MTELDIVRRVLQVQGEATVNSLTNPNGTVQQILAAIESENLDFQVRGWWFNTEHSLPLVPDNLGEVVVPENTIKFQITDSQLQYASAGSKIKYVLRGTRVYDAEKHTYTVGKTIVADISVLLPVTELPASAGSYLKHLIASNFYVDDDGDLSKASRLEARVARAWAQLQADELRAVNPNALQSPAAQALTYRVGQAGSPSNPMFPGGRRL